MSLGQDRVGRDREYEAFLVRRLLSLAYIPVMALFTWSFVYFYYMVMSVHTFHLLSIPLSTVSHRLSLAHCSLHEHCSVLQSSTLSSSIISHWIGVIFVFLHLALLRCCLCLSSTYSLPGSGSSISRLPLCT